MGIKQKVGGEKADTTSIEWSRPTGQQADSIFGTGRRKSPTEQADQRGEVEIKHEVEIKREAGGANDKSRWDTDLWWWLLRLRVEASSPSGLILRSRSCSCRQLLGRDP